MGCHTLPNPAWPQQCSWPAISEICPPGEGMILQIDRIFWDTRRRPDQGLGSGTDQPEYLSLVGVVARYSALFRPLRRPTDGSDS
jgi:hypothetical protein